MRVRPLVGTLGVILAVASGAAAYGALAAKQHATDFVTAVAKQDISTLESLGSADSTPGAQNLSLELFDTDAPFAPARVDASLDSLLPVQLIPVTYGVTVAVSGHGTPKMLEGDLVGIGIVLGSDGRPSVGQILTRPDL